MTTPQYTAGRYSYSALDAFETCPQQFAFGRVYGFPETAGDEKEVGKAAHTLLERYALHCLASGYGRDEDRLGELSREIEALLPAAQAEDLAYLSGQIAGAIEFLPSWQDVRVEHGYAFDATWSPVDWKAPTARFRMRVDLSYRDGTMLVVDDWKTSRRMPPQAEVERSLQLRTYGWALLQDFPAFDEILIRLRFVRYGSAERKVLLSRADLADVPKVLDARIAAIEAERRFEPKVGPLCLWCGYRNQCEAFKTVYHDGAIPIIATREDAEAGLQRLIVLEGLTRDLKESLRAFVDVEGAVAAGGKTYGYTAEERLVFGGLATTGNALVALGLSRELALEAFAATKTSVSDVLRRAGYKGKALAEALAKVAADTATKDVQTKLSMKGTK